MSYKFLEVETKTVVLKNGSKQNYTQLYLNNPPVNVISLELLKELAHFLENFGTKERLLVITGKGKAFAAGADIKEMSQMNEKDAFAYSRFGQMVFQKLEQSLFLTVALVHGYALGGGLELALACDIRILSESAVVGLPEVTLGLIPGFGGTVRLKQFLGEKAIYYILTGEKISASEAYALGLAHKVFSDANFLAESENFVQSLLQNGPKAQEKIKELFQRPHREKMFQDYLKESKAFAELFALEEAQEGLTAFLQKRPANFSYER